MAILSGIAVAPQKKGTLIELENVNISLEYGLEGDARGQKKKRQVTVLFQDDWEDTCNQLGAKLHWTKRRANLYISGMSCPKSIGSLINIGQVQLQISFETDPCARMDEEYLGLRKALENDWRGGVCCSVFRGGFIKIGDQVKLSNKK